MRDCVCFHVCLCFFCEEAIRRVKMEAFRMWVCESGSNVKMLVFPSRISSWLFCSVSPEHTRFQVLQSPSHCLSAGWWVFHFYTVSLSGSSFNTCPSMRRYLTVTTLKGKTLAQSIILKRIDKNETFNDASLCPGILRWEYLFIYIYIAISCQIKLASRKILEIRLGPRSIPKCLVAWNFTYTLTNQR